MNYEEETVRVLRGGTIHHSQRKRRANVDRVLSGQRALRCGGDGNDSHEDFLIFFAKGAFFAQYLGNIKCAPNTLYDEIGVEECYVVGNKWDNPELLEMKK